MSTKKFFLAGLLTVAAAALFFLFTKLFFERPLPFTVPQSDMFLLDNLSPTTYGPPATREVLGWIPYWDQQAAIASFRAQAEIFDHLGMFWYAINEDGTIRKYPYATIDRAFVASAQEEGVKVLAVITNLPPENEGGDWDAERIDLVLGSEEARTAHVADIMRLVQEENFDGVNIDYEAMEADQRKAFTLFIEELAAALHAQGKILGVSLMPKVGENNPQFSNGSQAQDWKQLAKYADHLYVMSYEQHWENSGPGSVAALPWMERVMAYARKLIPPEKLFGGLPMYGYDWPAGGGAATGLTYKQVQALIARHQPEVRWDEEAGSRFFTYDANGMSHTVGFEDAQSVAAKYQLFEKYGVGNAAVWRIGNEDERMWQAFATPTPSASPGSE